MRTVQERAAPSLPALGQRARVTLSHGAGRLFTLTVFQQGSTQPSGIGTAAFRPWQYPALGRRDNKATVAPSHKALGPFRPQRTKTRSLAYPQGCARAPLDLAGTLDCVGVRWRQNGLLVVALGIEPSLKRKGSHTKRCPRLLLANLASWMP